MCGIAGWILNEKPGIEFVSLLACVMQERGLDSFGFYNGDTKQIVKGESAIMHRLKMSELQFSQGFIHTRHATAGKVNIENCHPFQIGNIIGAHNGVIYNHYQLDNKYKRNHEVDSQHIFSHINEGLDLSDVEGYGAIEFVKDGEYYLGRCNGGELVIALLDNDDGIVWASTKEAIEAAVFQSGMKIETYYNVVEGEIFQAKLDSLYKTDEKFNLKKSLSTYKWNSGKSSMGSLIHGWERDESFGTFNSSLEDITTDIERNPSSDIPEAWHDFCDFCHVYDMVTPYEEGTMLCHDCMIMAESYDIQIQPDGNKNADNN